MARPESTTPNLPFEVGPAWWVRIRASIRLLINVVGAGGITVLTGGHARFVAPYRPTFDAIALPLGNLGVGFVGFRILQLTDLHIESDRSLRHLREIIARVNTMDVDLVVVTGDLVSSNPRPADGVCEALGRLRNRTLVTFGNHDYNASPMPYASAEIADALQAKLEERNIEVLRNRAVAITRGDDRLWIAGLEDLWSGKYSIESALADVPADEPCIALSHNPDTGPALARRGVQVILSGHTHGGQIRLPGLRPLMLPIENKRFASGLFDLGEARLFVSRGLGQRVPVRFRCPPQVTTFVLEQK